MSFFAWPFRVLFQDTMAYGWHHFLTNLKFQCDAREHFLYAHVLATEEARAACADILFIAREGYTRNLAPVPVGENVGILLSQEEPDALTTRWCFRVVRSDGAPVCCGFQDVVATTRKGEPVPVPEVLRRLGPSLREKLCCPSFAERVLAGTGIAKVFDESVIALGKKTASGPRDGSLPASWSVALGEDALAFVFPGAASFTDPRLLADLVAASPESGPLLRRAEEIARSVLGTTIQPFLEGAEKARAHGLAHPGVVQPAIYLSSVLAARWLMERGARPAVFVGHSLGELAALAASGVLTVEDGLEAVARRARALATAADVGGMLVVFCPERRARSLIEAIGRSTLEVAVVNSPEQTVVSGSHADLERLSAFAGQLEVATTRLESDFPFHSKLLQPCVAPFAEALRSVRFGAPDRPVYSPMERAFLAKDADWPGILSSHFVRPLGFADTIRDLHVLGARRFVECGGGKALAGLFKKALGGVETCSTAHPSVRDGLARALDLCRVAPRTPGPASAPATTTSAAPRTSVPASDVPIAIVGRGCVLPGSFGPEQLWKSALAARTAITDSLTRDARDFLSEGEGIVPDKSYSRLGGWVRGFEPDAKLPLLRSDSQRFLATALSQCLDGLGSLPAAPRLRLFVGSTADGCREYDDALLLAGLQALAGPELAEALEELVGRRLAESGDFSPWPLYDEVAKKLLGPGVPVLAVDAACASSLYAIAAGIRDLRSGACDLAFAGGVFAPGAPNAALFAQFRGLSARASRPLDAEADGVVFSEGSGLLALERLPDALAKGRRIHAVIRGVACSSDGKSPSVMEPREAGQVLAMRRAYETTGVDPASIQFLEAHATGTTVGDAVEVRSAARVLGGRAGRVGLGSLKGLIGHSGWAAGAASTIEMTCALAERTFPPQTAFTTPSPRLEIERTPFEVSARPRPWPENAPGEPRRAAVNGFGFGGSNAHLVLEEPGASAPRSTAASPPTESIAVVALATHFPASGPRFSEPELAFPDKVRILPDVADDMDRGQALAIIVAHRALAALPGWQLRHEEIGVILGVEGKTGRGIDANLRIFRDQLLRKIGERAIPEPRRAALHELVSERLGRLRPSGPYTLLGLMPNVISGRVANTFNLRGPNVVVDGHRASLARALQQGAAWLAAGDCRLVIAGAINGHAHPAVEALVRASHSFPESRSLGEAAVVVGLTRASVAKENGWTVLATLGPSSASALRAGSGERCLLGAEGAVEIARAIESARSGEAARVAWTTGQEIGFLPATAATPGTSAPAPAIPAATWPAKLELAEPCLFPRQLREAARIDLATRRVLALVDDARDAELARRFLEGVEHRLVAPRGAGIPGAVAIDLESDATFDQDLAALDGSHDVLLAVKDLAGLDPVGGACRASPLLEILFGVARRDAERMGRGEVLLATVALRAFVDARLHPFTGLLSGFAKSVAREMPRAVVKTVSLEDDEPRRARERLEAELGARGEPVEVAYRENERLAFRLVVQERAQEPAWLDASSVVLATGGARGITAVLVEEIVRRAKCTVVLLGRTEVGAVPPSVAKGEAEFYREELARDPRARMGELRSRFEGLRASLEVSTTLARIQELGGRAHYVRADATDARAVSAAIASIMVEHGRLDLVLHGAGVQTSKPLARRQLGELRRTLETKLTGLANLRAACLEHVLGAGPRFHVLTSAFSHVGNPGQHDYGAANEALDRICALGGERWSSLGWLGWEDTGMTRGSEYRMLAQELGLGFVTRDEGREVFGRFLDGYAGAGPRVLLRDRRVVRDIPLEIESAPPASGPAPHAAARVLVPAEASASSPVSLGARRVLVVTDRPEWLETARGRRLLAALPLHRLVVPAGVPGFGPGAIALDLESDATLARTSERLGAFDHDAVLAVSDLSDQEVLAVTARSPLVELLHAVAKDARGRPAVSAPILAGLSLDPWRPGGQLHPATGLLASFLEALAQGVPGAAVKVLHTDAAEPLAHLERELGAATPLEVAERDGERFAFALTDAGSPALGAALLGPSSIVVATGGGRGLTALLVEELLVRFGCTVVVLGRSDPDGLPPELGALDDAAFEGAEPRFHEGAATRGERLATSSSRFQGYRAARETRATLARLAALGRGRVSYVRCDVTDRDAVRTAMATVAREHGHVDLVLHGASARPARPLARTTLAELRRGLATRLQGAGNLRRACAESLPEARPHFHFVGRGEPADEALGRLAACQDALGTHGEWSLAAWPEGSLPASEVRRFFGELASGRPAAPVLAPAREAAPSRGPCARLSTREASTAAFPFVAHHLVGGVPTLPGTLLIELAVQAAVELRPDRKGNGVRIEEASFDRFVRVGRPKRLAVLARVVADGERETIVQVRVLSDFVHANGAVLRRDTQHMSTLVVLPARPLELGEPRALDAEDALEVQDPYLHAEAPVRLSGPFASLASVACGVATTSAPFRPVEPPAELAGALTPVLLLDALFRAAGTRAAEPTIPILAPVHCGRLELATDAARASERSALLLSSPLRLEEDLGFMDWAEARTRDGRVIARAEDLLGRRMGAVPRVELSRAPGASNDEG